MRDPHDLLDPEVGAQPLLDLVPRQRGVAAGVKQALLGGDQRALAVHRDRAALEHQVGREPLDPEPGQQRPVHRVVAVIGSELLTPAVEAEVHPGAAAVGRGDDDRPAVAHPGVVDRQLDRTRTPSPHASRTSCERPCGATISTGSNAAIARGHRGVLGLGLGQPVAPQLDARRPGHQGPLVLRPLGRHRQPEGRCSRVLSLRRSARCGQILRIRSRAVAWSFSPSAGQARISSPSRPGPSTSSRRSDTATTVAVRT